MMDSDDDIYPDSEPAHPLTTPSEVTMNNAEDDEEEGEEVEDDDSDDEINFITDAKQEPKIETAPASNIQQKRSNAPVHITPDTRKSSTPVPGTRSESTTQLIPQSQVQHRGQTPVDNHRPGSTYPARHISNLDPQNGNPVHPATGKTILSTDLDTDFGSGEDDKPWRKPGVDITDFFNYGFDEFTWASYCLKKQDVPKEIKGIKDDAEQMKSFLEGMGGGFPGMAGMGGMAGANGAVPANTGTTSQNTNQGQGAMPGMPSEADMQQMFQLMMAQGMDPSQMDPSQMMQMMMGGGGGPQGNGGFGGGQQPPSGPAGGFSGSFDQGGGGGGFGSGGGGGGGGRGRGRRGRGNW